MHYATRYKKRIWFLEQKISEYYLANYEAKKSVGINPGICGVSDLSGNEERLIVSDVESMRRIIKNLPLMDCGV